MKRFIMAFTTCVLFGLSSMANISYGQEVQEDSAKVVVEGPTQVNAGDLVVISVEKSNAKSFKWLVLPATENYLVIDEGKRIVFSSGVGGDYRFIVACGVADTCDVSIHTLNVKGNAGSPLSSLSSKVSSWCDLVESPTKRDDCIKLAQSFASVALVMDGGTLVTPGEIVEATYSSNKEALGDRVDVWTPFRANLAKELGRMAEEGKLETTGAHIEVWKAIASALREYADKL